MSASRKFHRSMEWENNTEAPPEIESRLLNDLGLDESSSTEESTVKTPRKADDSCDGIVKKQISNGVRAPAKSRTKSSSSIFSNMGAALQMEPSSDIKTAETSEEIMEIPKAEFCSLNNRLIQRNREVRESVQKLQDSQKRVIMLNRLVKSLKQKSSHSSPQLSERTRKRLKAEELVDELTEEGQDNDWSTLNERTPINTEYYNQETEKVLVRMESELKQKTIKVAEVQRKFNKMEAKLQISDEKIAFMEHSAKKAEKKLASIRLRDSAQVNKMMAALGANEEATQQMVRDVKLENQSLKKNIGILQVEKANLQKKLECERVQREKVERESRELELKLEGFIGDAAVARRKTETSSKLIEDFKRKAEEAEKQSIKDKLLFKEKYRKLAEDNILNWKNKLEKKLATKVKHVQKYHEQNAKKFAYHMTRSNALNKKVLSIVSFGIDAIRSSQKELHSGQRDIMKMIKSGCSRLSVMGGAEVQELKKKYAREVFLRRKYWNKIQELRGNIRVFCRVRPVLKKEKSIGHNDAVTFTDDGDLVILNQERNSQHRFSFDEVFKPNTSQEQIFDKVCGLIRSVCDGFHVCIFAYGQTGTGKTFTMQGPSNNPGVNSRALALLFETIKTEFLNHDFTVGATLIEIYNEKIFDLVRERSDCPLLKPRETKDGIIVPGLTINNVRSADDVQRLLKAGEKNRSVGKTDMNAHSSRSHLILTVEVRCTDRTTRRTTTGKLHLIDLAGSERLKKSKAEGARRTEAKHINTSLSALGDVIAAKANCSSHVPYRNSTLTYLLKDSLDKKSKMVMFVQVSPLMRDAGESVCSLTFATRANKIELGQAEARKTRGRK